MRRRGKKGGMALLAGVLMPALLGGCGEIQVLLPYKDVPYMASEPAPEEEEAPADIVAEPVEMTPAEPEEEPTEEPEVEPEEEKPRIFTPGVVTGNSYENVTLGIGLTLDDDWTYTDEAEIAKLNKLKEPATTESATAFLEEPEEYVDMDVLSGGIGNEITVSVINSTFIGTDDLSRVAEDDCEAVMQQLTDAKCEEVEGETLTVNFLGEELNASKVTCINEGNEYTVMRIQNIKNGYFYTVMLMYFGNDQSEKLISCFYEVNGETV